MEKGSSWRLEAASVAAISITTASMALEAKAADDTQTAVANVLRVPESQPIEPRRGESRSFTCGAEWIDGALQFRGELPRPLNAQVNHASTNIIPDTNSERARVVFTAKDATNPGLTGTAATYEAAVPVPGSLPGVPVFEREREGTGMGNCILRRTDPPARSESFEGDTVFEADMLVTVDAGTKTLKTTPRLPDGPGPRENITCVIHTRGVPQVGVILCQGEDTGAVYETAVSSATVPIVSAACAQKITDIIASGGQPRQALTDDTACAADKSKPVPRFTFRRKASL